MDIKPYPKNAKTHPDSQLKQIADSVKQFGWQQPIVVDQEGTIIVGHGRWEAYKKYNLPEPPIQVATLNKEQTKAYRLADNKLNESNWDMGLVIEELKDLDSKGFDITLTGFNFKLKDIDLVLDPSDEWQGMPRFELEDKTAYRQLLVSFHNEEAVQEFAELVKQTITPTTRYLWFPKEEHDKVAGIGYE